jgi:hypothetical protein
VSMNTLNRCCTSLTPSDDVPSDCIPLQPVFW